MSIFNAGDRYGWLGTFTAVTLTLVNPAAIAQTLTSAGDSFPEPLYRRYFEEYAADSGVEIEYAAIGSGGGIRRFIDESVDFAASSIPPTPLDASRMKRGLQLVPTAGGAVAVIYNLQSSADRFIPSQVRISREVLGKIFSGEITNWKQISSNLPNLEIRIVVHSGSSGTNFIFTRHLNAITNGAIAATQEPNWGFPVIGKSSDSDVAAAVKLTEGAIGYVQASFAREQNVKMAKIENRAGEWVKPSLDETNKALANVVFNPDFTVENLRDPEEGYPIVGLTWLFVYRRYPDVAAVESVIDLVSWILTQGQNLNEELEYTRIPEAVAQQAIEAVRGNVAVEPF